MTLLVTCDGGGWKTPPRVRTRLEAFGRSLSKKYPVGDRAAMLAAMAVARIAGGELIVNENRPELIDVGRSLGRSGLYGKALIGCDKRVRQTIIDEIYRPYRRRVSDAIAKMLTVSPFVVHLSIRSFAAKRSDGRWRRGDVGLAYDPASSDEVDWCLDLIDELWQVTPMLKVRRNYPRRGTHDTLTRAMRRVHGGGSYIGVEVMLNRAWLDRPGTLRDQALAGLACAIGNVTATTESIAA